MANLKTIKAKIKSVANLKKITKALEIVSTVKLQKSKAQAEALKEYLVGLLKLITSLGLNLDMFDQEVQSTKSTKDLVIIVTTERGLCGAINSKLLRKAYQEQQWVDTDWFVLGTKGIEFFKRGGANIVGSLHLSDTFKQEELLPLYTFFDEAMSNGSYASIKIYFNYFKNTVNQIATSMQVMPFDQAALQNFLDDVGMSFANLQIPAHDTMIIEPNKEILQIELQKQIRKYLLSAAVIQNKAGEHASRMIAMKNAKDNATWFVKKLTRHYNKTRQWVITQEISEIVSAKIAIEG